jgi:hypothetical protein
MAVLLVGAALVQSPTHRPASHEPQTSLHHDPRCQAAPHPREGGVDWRSGLRAAASIVPVEAKPLPAVQMAAARARSDEKPLATSAAVSASMSATAAAPGSGSTGSSRRPVCALCSMMHCCCAAATTLRLASSSPDAFGGGGSQSLGARARAGAGRARGGSVRVEWCRFDLGGMPRAGGTQLDSGVGTGGFWLHAHIA